MPEPPLTPDHPSPYSAAVRAKLSDPLMAKAIVALFDSALKRVEKQVTPTLPQANTKTRKAKGANAHV